MSFVLSPFICPFPPCACSFPAEALLIPSWHTSSSSCKPTTLRRAHRHVHATIKSAAFLPEQRGTPSYNNSNDNKDDKNVPVRPKTRVTLTSLTGTFADSIFDYLRILRPFLFLRLLISKGTRKSCCCVGVEGAFVRWVMRWCWSLHLGFAIFDHRAEPWWLIFFSRAWNGAWRGRGVGV